MSKSDMRRVIDEYVGGGGDPRDVLGALVDAMMETAEHISTNWQDRAMARDWERAAIALDKFGARWKLP